jgi:hypothetical protein
MRRGLPADPGCCQFGTPKGPVKGDLADERLRRAGLRRRLRRAFGGTFIVFWDFPPPGKPSFGEHNLEKALRIWK